MGRFVAQNRSFDHLGLISARSRTQLISGEAPRAARPGSQFAPEPITGASINGKGPPGKPHCGPSTCRYAAGEKDAGAQPRGSILHHMGPRRITLRVNDNATRLPASAF
jgi:hypothetical protein